MVKVAPQQIALALRIHALAAELTHRFGCDSIDSPRRMATLLSGGTSAASSPKPPPSTHRYSPPQLPCLRVLSNEARRRAVAPRLAGFVGDHRPPVRTF